MEEKPKFSLVEIVLVLMIVIPVDILDVISVLISPVPVIGQIVLVVMWFVDLISLLAIQFWLIMKRVKGLWALSGNILELIPFVNALPLRTISIIITIVLANRPETTKIAQVAKTATGK